MFSVHPGVTKNIHIGYIKDFNAFGEEMLKRDFCVVSDIRLISLKKNETMGGHKMCGWICSTPVPCD